MLELQNLNKYFNRYHKNSIHAINHTSLTFSSSGLVALLGPSGCGKTTLLNVIGGLDKPNQGKIFLNKKRVSINNVYQLDKIRAINIGYIFQDYKLVEDLTVFQNVELVLKMIGIKDKEEIKKRCEYVLERVGMLRYQKRPASMLSGGERQRVGIARALVKNPAIILADEPTGNLDSKNSIEVMNIIKSISKDRLVILVTHETDLAKFYATRILEIEDGKIINDYQNEHENDLDYQQDGQIYLRDLPKTTLAKNENTIHIYKQNHEKININLVLKNGNIYIDCPDYSVQVVGEESNVSFIDDYYQTIKKDAINHYKFDFTKLDNTNQKIKYTSIYNFPSYLFKSFQKVLDFPILKKILLVGFFLSGIFIVYALSSIRAILEVHEEDFVTQNKDYLIVTKLPGTVEEYNQYSQIEGVDYLLVGDSIASFHIQFDDYYQSTQVKGNLKGSVADIKLIGEDDLVKGRMPENSQEVVVDELVLNKLLKEEEYYQMIGVLSFNDFLEREITIPNLEPFKIVGLTNQLSPSIYVMGEVIDNILIYQSEDEAASIFTNSDISENSSNSEFIDYHLVKDNIQLIKGVYPENDYEVIVPVNYEEEMPLNHTIKEKINSTELKVVGYYKNKYNNTMYLTNFNTVKYNFIETKKNLTIYPASLKKNQVLKAFKEMNLNIKDSYDLNYKQYMDEHYESIKTTLMVSGIILFISLIEIFLMIRSSFLSRIKEIGIYRAIGIKKYDIYKMFMAEVCAITTIAGVPGILLMSYILKVLSGVSFFSRYIIITKELIFLSIIFIYLFNILIGLIPVYHVIKKRPASILARYDLD